MTTCRLAPLAPAMLAGSTGAALSSVPEMAAGSGKSGGGRQAAGGASEITAPSNLSDISTSSDSAGTAAARATPLSAARAALLPSADVRIPIDADSSGVGGTSKSASLAGSADQAGSHGRQPDDVNSDAEAAPPKRQTFGGGAPSIGKRGMEKQERRKEKEDKEKSKPTRFKIDPKTLFANERTMLQWLNSARGSCLPTLFEDRPDSRCAFPLPVISSSLPLPLAVHLPCSGCAPRVHVPRAPRHQHRGGQQLVHKSKCQAARRRRAALRGDPRPRRSPGHDIWRARQPSVLARRRARTARCPSVLALLVSAAHVKTLFPPPLSAFVPLQRCGATTGASPASPARTKTLASRTRWGR